jgi:hypothetical protein
VGDFLLRFILGSAFRARLITHYGGCCFHPFPELKHANQHIPKCPVFQLAIVLYRFILENGLEFANDGDNTPPENDWRSLGNSTAALGSFMKLPT